MQQGVGDRLHLIAPETPLAMERLGAQYDIGFSGETGFSRNNSLALGNKLFSYLCSGLPILASSTASHQAIATELGDAMALFPAGNAAALATLLDDLLLNPVRLAAAREDAWRLGQGRYCWEEEQGALLRSVDAAFVRITATTRASR
ncbi:glycosyltransferase family protein [Terricaulis silvestris]|nr:hypothetical protein [Terricaulis silvestris]